jgi:hypothetical protein
MENGKTKLIKPRDEVPVVLLFVGHCVEPEAILMNGGDQVHIDYEGYLNYTN